MLTVTKEVQFEMAHRLTNHKGACKNLHGHTYKLFVTVRSIDWQKLEETDMVLDFSDVKQILTDKIVNMYDHATVLKNCNQNEDLIDLLETMDMKVLTMSSEPTAERMLQDMVIILEPKFAEKGIGLVSMKLYETSTSYAEVKL